MPFWWPRRRRFWYGRYKTRYNRTNRRNKRRKYPKRRRRPRPHPRRRRRRRRRRVRKKKKTIAVRQWQPDSIVHCKIKGFDCLLLGAQGKQYDCYNATREQFVPPKGPGGGGFTSTVYSLQGLYEQYHFRKNIWTKSNIFKDLVRYLRCKFTVYRHPTIDLIFGYERQPPFDLTKWSYTAMHPTQLLLSQHKKILLSTANNPKGKISKKLLIKPPKQMLSKWFFAETFSHYPLVHIKASAASFSYATIGCCNTSTQLNIYYLNRTFYAQTGWGFEAQATSPYKPNNMSLPFVYTYKKPNGQTETATFNQPSTYAKSVSYNEGWFTTKLLNATKINNQAAIPISIARYIPESDDGIGNKMYWVSVVKAQPIEPSDEDLVYHNLPLWLGLYGWVPYIIQKKKDKTFLNTHYLVLESKSIYIFGGGTTTRTQIIPVDTSFINGQAPFNEYVTQSSQTAWYPKFEHQVETINNIICCGPLIPKLQTERNSTWEFDCQYCFNFKWGGPQITDQEVADPTKLPSYDVPDHFKGTIQISNPAKQTSPSLLHPWDYRRGIITNRALKRISEHIETDTDFYPDAEPPKKKKKAQTLLRVPEEENKEVKTCLLSLCEENIYQEEETPNIQQLIKQQREYQHNLRRNILTILSDLKDKQRMLQLQTGILE
nr:MAG: ORF1 [Torque teno midi virus]